MQQPLETDSFPVADWPIDRTAVAASDTTAAAHGLAPGLLLASVGDRGWVIPPRHALSAGIAASALVELALRGRASADGRRLLVTNAAPTGDAVVDPVLELLAVRRRAPDVGRCLAELSLDWTILGRAGQLLEERGLVHIERRALHPLLMNRFHPVPPHRPAQLRARLRSVLEGATATPRDAALASLAAAAGVLGLPRMRSAGLDAASRALVGTEAAAILSAVHPAVMSAADARREAQPAASA